MLLFGRECYQGDRMTWIVNDQGRIERLGDDIIGLSSPPDR